VDGVTQQVPTSIAGLTVAGIGAYVGRKGPRWTARLRDWTCDRERLID
jgi:hypothetical protein